MKEACKQAIFRKDTGRAKGELKISGQQEIKIKDNWSFSTTSKVLKSNGQVIYTSTYWALMDDELSNHNEVMLQDEFDKDNTAKLGSPMSELDLSPEGLDAKTPTFDIYEDDETMPLRLPEVDDVTPKDSDNYVGSEVNIPDGGCF